MEQTSFKMNDPEAELRGYRLTDTNKGNIEYRLTNDDFRSQRRIGYFGSYATEQQTDNSDLDLLVEFSEPVGWGFFTLERFLEQSLGLRIDLVTPNALKERIKESILNQVRYI